MKSTGLLEKVEGSLAGLGVARGSRVLVGCSGGPDSTALLVALSELAAGHGLSIVPAYVDHGIRDAGERAAERSAAEEACRRVGLTLTVLPIEPGLLERDARQAHRSLEETARSRRIDSLRRAAREAGCGLIALGHTHDDQVETLLMRFFQGSGAAGLAGIAPRAGQVIRPLLRCTREDVLDFLSRRAQGFHADSSNADQRFLRNGVRARLVPVLRQVFPGYARALDSLARKMSDLAGFVDAELARRDVWKAETAGFSADAEAFYALPAALRAESLYRVVDRTAAVRGRLSYRSIERLVHDRPRAVDRLLRDAEVRIWLHKNRFLVTRDIVCPGKTGYFTLVAEPVEKAVRAGPYRLASRPPAEAPAEVGDGGPQAISIGRAGIQPPVVVRSRRRGDRVPTAAGTTSLKKLLSQWGVPLEARDEAGVVADAQGVIAAFALPWGACVADRGRAAGRGFLTVAAAGERRS